MLEEKIIEQIKEKYNFDKIKDSNEFVSFLCSDRGPNIMPYNSLSIHIESGNVFSKISIRMKIFIVFCLHIKMKQKKLYQKE